MPPTPSDGAHLCNTRKGQMISYFGIATLCKTLDLEEQDPVFVVRSVGPGNAYFLQSVHLKTTTAQRVETLLDLYSFRAWERPSILPTSFSCMRPRSTWSTPAERRKSGTMVRPRFGRSGTQVMKRWFCVSGGVAQSTKASILALTAMARDTQAKLTRLHPIAPGYSRHAVIPQG